MSQEDSRAAQPMSRHIEEWAERRMRNVAETYVTKADSNASLQKSDPEHYGPYLEEGESYQTPRTAEDVEKACKEMGVYKMMDNSEQAFFRSLVYRHWRLSPPVHQGRRRSRGREAGRSPAVRGGGCPGIKEIHRHKTQAQDTTAPSTQARFK